EARLPRPAWGPDARGRTTWTRGRVLAGGALLTAALLVFHAAVPNAVWRLGSLVESFLPWLGLAVPALLVLGLARRSATALIAAALPVAVWLVQFGGALVDDPRDEGFTVVQHNVSDENPDPAGTALALAAAEPELIALEELTPAALPVYTEMLAASHPFHTVVGTVGLWSRHPLADTWPVDIKPAAFPMTWSRGLRATVLTPNHGEVTVYVAHLPSLRLGVSGFGSGPRDESAALLAAAIDAEPARPMVLLGDLNGTVDDRGLAPLVSRTGEPERDLAFSWPASLPLARVDQVLAAHATVTGVRTLPATGSDHLPVAAEIGF
ncbi:MAG TPA: endonuclease/exonuclease/phosphatase family protein, partial [Phytomonospora sp.]